MVFPPGEYYLFWMCLMTNIFKSTHSVNIRFSQLFLDLISVVLGYLYGKINTLCILFSKFLLFINKRLGMTIFWVPFFDAVHNFFQILSCTIRMKITWQLRFYDMKQPHSKISEMLICALAILIDNRLFLHLKVKFI